MAEVMMMKFRSFLRARRPAEVALLIVVGAGTVVALGAKLGAAIANFAAAV
jgi:hypothetical protein